MNDTLTQDLKSALMRDFYSLYKEEYTTDYKIKRMIRNTEIQMMNFDNVQKFIEKYFEPKE